MNSYTNSSNDQISGWDLFTSLYATPAIEGGGDTPTNNEYYLRQQELQHQQEQQQAAAQLRANHPYYAVRFGYTLGVPYYGEGAGVVEGGGSSHRGFDPSNHLNGGEAHQHQRQWNLNHVDEMNAGLAVHPHGPPRGSGGNDEQDVPSRQPFDYYENQNCMTAQQQQQQQQVTNGWGASNHPPSRSHEASLHELDYCDFLLRGLDNNSAHPAQTQATGNSNNNNMNHSQLIENQFMWNQMRGQQPMWSSHGGGAEKSPILQGQTGKPSKSNNLDYFVNHGMQHHQHQSYASASSKPKSQPTTTGSTSSQYHPIKPSHKSITSTTTTTTPHPPTSTPSSYLPHSSNNSSQLEKQIDPLLETLSLSIPSVSLTSLTGNEIIMHIRSKTDDVITRFLPCVEFLVNCQQELRQGLAIANQRKYISNNSGRSRSTVNMSPHQFFVRFVAPLPNKFERKCDYLMAREHLLAAKLQLDRLVEEARSAVPQGCEQVKNTFLGGMRENESWGLRKWLSKHGGAGTICNDLEEVLRKVKSLKREEKTTIKLAEQLRPIAGQAHDRLKKDVPQAYQELSSAHPFLPFFHRLEACLKQMATYDPEDDDVICLDSDDDDDDVVEVKVESNQKKEAEPPKSSAVKKRILHKREREEDESTNTSMIVPQYKRGKSLENITPQKVEKRTFHGGSQPEVICLDDSSDDEGEENNGQCSQMLKLEGGFESPSQTPIPEVDKDNMEDRGWRCQHCTCLNAPNVLKCTMCNDEDSTTGNETDELARFLGDGGIMEDLINASDG